MKVICDEVFGPVISLLPYDDIDEVFRFVSNSRFGLQTGIFTKSIELAIRAVRSLRTGSIINGSSTWRTDQLAYGEVDDSRLGLEGPRYSIHDMTEERMVLFSYGRKSLKTVALGVDSGPPLRKDRSTIKQRLSHARIRGFDGNNKAAWVFPGGVRNDHLQSKEDIESQRRLCRRFRSGISGDRLRPD